MLGALPEAGDEAVPSPLLDTSPEAMQTPLPAPTAGGDTAMDNFYDSDTSLPSPGYTPLSGLIAQSDTRVENTSREEGTPDLDTPEEDHVINFYYGKFK